MLEFKSFGEVASPSSIYSSHVAGDLELRLSNIRANLGKKAITKDSAERNSDVMKLACYGPSLEHNWEHILADEGDLWAVSGANAFLWEKGISPRFHLESDPRPHKADLLSGASPTTTYLIASRCHPRMFQVLEGKNVLLYHVNVDDEREAVPEGEFLFPAAWSMGNTALLVGLVLGYKRFLIYGMDGSFTEKQHAGSHPGEAEAFQMFRVDGEREFLSHPVHTVALESLLNIVEMQPYGTFTFVGDGMIPYAYRKYTKEFWH